MSASIPASIDRATVLRGVLAAFPDATDAQVTAATDGALRAMLDYDLARKRTEGVAAVLDAVRRTGRSAHPTAVEAVMPGAVSALVFSVALARNVAPVALQAEVNAYADAQDAYAREGL